MVFSEEIAVRKDEKRFKKKATYKVAFSDSYLASFSLILADLPERSRR